MLVVLNFADEACDPELHLPEQIKAWSGASPLRDVLVDEDVPVSEGDALRISMPAWSARILTRDT